MRHFALIGNPLGHSFSAKYFAEKFKKLHIDASYSLCEAQCIEQAIEMTKDCEGFNVTIPFKEKIIPFLDVLTPQARSVGAVNCVRRREGLLTGFNTDVEGIKYTLSKFEGRKITGALVLGTGGASKAVRYVLEKMSIPYKTISRDTSRGILYSEITSDTLKKYTLIINTTPLGMFPNCDTMPDINPDFFSEQNIIFDLVYNPDPTKLMIEAKKRGALAVSGIEMLHRQAEVSWQIWNSGNNTFD